MTSTVIWLIVVGGIVFISKKQRGETVRMNVKQNMHVKDLGVSSQTWQAFCHLAAARRVSQTKQIGEAIIRYMEDSKII
jgi:mevalonate kinase